MSKKVELCIYCGAQATTRDHVPPKSFFIKPAPKNLITVPSCFDCNNSLSKDEEYTRTILSSAWQDDGSTKLAETIWHGPVSRSLLRNQKVLKQIIKGFREMDVFYGSIYLGKQLAITFDKIRVNPVIKKIVKGLFYHTWGRPLNHDFNIKVMFNPDPTKLPEEVVRHVIASDQQELAGGVIRYKSIFVPENPDYSAWAISFYNNDNATFVCLTGSDETGI